VYEKKKKKKVLFVFPQGVARNQNTELSVATVEAQQEILGGVGIVE